ncbi:MAG: hypothetical protein VB027_07700 [Gordonibacter sp.]|nr:hypothetical protein [Gordonibacter sp.]
MKNFEMQYPIDGSSALQPEFQHESAHTGHIIEFSTHTTCGSHSPTQRVTFGMHTDTLVDTTSRSGRKINLVKNEMVDSLRYGAIGGMPYDRIKPWQAVLATGTFSILAFASIFVGF